MIISKKIFITSTLLLAVVFLFWGIYLFSFKKPAEMPRATVADQPAPSASLPEKNKSIRAVSDEAVVGATLAPDENSLKYYAKKTGQTYKVDLDGQNKTLVSSRETPGLVEVFWSPDKTRAISRYFQEGKDRFAYFNYSENKGAVLKDNLDTVAWQTNGKIFYKYYSSTDNKRSLNIANPDGTDWKKIADIPHRNVVIAPIPRTGLVSFWNAPDAFAETIFSSAPVIGGEGKTLVSGKFGADYLWSSDGSKILVSHSAERGGTKMQLAVTNDRGGEYRNLEMPTLVSKCAWSRDNKNIFCALPGSIPDTAVLPNDYLAGKFQTVDTFWKINTLTGEKERIIELNKIEESFDVLSIFLNNDESFLFFTSRADGKLYRIDL